VGIVLLLLGTVAHAAPSVTCNVPTSTDICVDFVYSFVDEISPNLAGYPIGTNLSFGGFISPPNVFPPDVKPAMVTATQGATTLTVPYTGSPAIPNDHFKTIPYNPSLTGPWSLTVTDTTGSLVVPTAAVGPTAPLPFVKSMTLTPNSGSPTQPTLNWTIPSGAPVTNTSIFIFNLDVPRGPQGFETLIFSQEGLPPTMSFTVPATLPGGSPGLVPGIHYSVGIQLDQDVPHGVRPPFQSRLESRSRSFFNFTLPTGGPTVVLPSVGPDGTYHFNTTVVGGQTIFVDPKVAVGYDYAIGAGDPNFASVVLPTGINSNNKYDLSLFDTSGQPFDTTIVTGGIPYSFLSNGFPDGVDAFQVSGIDPAAGLDPDNPLAFITGLTFTADGDFTGTMTPIVAQVPEPSTFLLMGASLFGVAGIMWRRRSRPNRLSARSLDTCQPLTTPPSAPQRL
jgi:hypothetical protein